MNLTELELKTIENIGDNDYVENPNQSSWAFCAYTCASHEIDPKISRGAVSSLSKKGLIEIDIDEEGRKTGFAEDDESTINLTEAGLTVFKEHFSI